MADSVIVKFPPPKALPGKKSIKGLIIFLLFAFGGGVLGGMTVKHLGHFLLPAGDRVGIKIAALVTLPLIWIAVISWHELGHVLAGKCVGGRFLLFVVGPFKWQRTPSGVRFSWNRSINLVGGLAACLPMDDRDLPKRMLVMIAGGPIASLVLAVSMLWLAVIATHHEWLLAHYLTLEIAGISGLIFLVTILPGEAGGLKTDGRRLLEFARVDARAKQEAALLSITVASLAGVRPAEYSEEKIVAIVALDDHSLNTLYGHYTVFLHAADRQEWPRAQAHLDRVIAGESVLPPFMRDVVRADYAWLLTQPGGDAAAARAWLETAGKVAFDPATRLRAEAAVLLAENQFAEAAGKASEALVALTTKSMAPVPNAWALELCKTIRQRAQSLAIEHPCDPA